MLLFTTMNMLFSFKHQLQLIVQVIRSKLVLLLQTTNLFQSKTVLLSLNSMMLTSNLLVAYQMFELIQVLLKLLHSQLLNTLTQAHGSFQLPLVIQHHLFKFLLLVQLHNHLISKLSSNDFFSVTKQVFVVLSKSIVIPMNQSSVVLSLPLVQSLKKMFKL